MYRTLLCWSGGLLVAGCSLAPEFERPAAPVPAAFPTASLESAPAVTSDTLEWQRFFGDPGLRDLITQALEHNREMRLAGLEVERIQAVLRIQRSAMIPSLDALADGTRQRIPGDLSSTGEAATGGSYRIGLNVPSYELDFFGRVASLRDQALQQYLASEEGFLSAQLSLISAVARQYFLILALREEIDLAGQNLESAERSLQLNQQSFDAGLGNELDLRTAEGQVERYRADQAILQEGFVRAENALTFLLGRPVQLDSRSTWSLTSQKLIENLPAGLPSELLNRRPDLRAAEHLLRAADARIGEARAAFFPSVKLTAFGGTASSELSGLFSDGSGAWSFTPSINLPLFSSGLNEAGLEIARVEKRMEIARYERAVQNAFREVADGLAARAHIDSRIKAQISRVAAASRRLQLTEERFESGLDSFLPVLLARQELSTAQRTLVAAKLDRLLNLTDLFAALGGGFEAPSGG